MTIVSLKVTLRIPDGVLTDSQTDALCRELDTLMGRIDNTTTGWAYENTPNESIMKAFYQVDVEEIE